MTKMSSKTQVNCGDFPTLAQANLQQKVKQAAERQFALRKGRQQSEAAAKARGLNAARSAWEKSSDNSYAGAATWALLKKPKAPAPAPAKAPAKAQPKAPAPAPTKSPWTKVRAKKKKPKAKKARLPLPDFIASLKKQIKVLNQKKAKALRDGKTIDAESFQRQINRLWGMMKRAEERLRKSGCRDWNARKGGLRKEVSIADYVKAAKPK
jgi:hypothetical protein